MKRLAGIKKKIVDETYQVELGERVMCI